MNEIIKKIFFESAELISESAQLSDNIEESVKMICNCIQNNNQIYLFGNGGSAADAQHIAAEFVGRYKMERESIPAVSLTTDTSILTSIGNDYSFEKIFSRQCEGLVNQDDVIITISTSGNSKNVINGIISAKNKGAKTIGLLGNGGGTIKDLVDISLIVNSNSTARIQEVHRVVYHIICELVERELATS